MPLKEPIMDTANVTEQIVVPLDGSPLAEQALPVAVRLAATLCRPLALVRIIPPDTWILSGPNMSTARGDVPGDPRRRGSRRARIYRPNGRGHSAEGRHRDDARRSRSMATALLDLLPNLYPVMIVMTSHGRTGMAPDSARQHRRPPRAPFARPRRWCCGRRFGVADTILDACDRAAGRIGARGGVARRGSSSSQARW